MRCVNCDCESERNICGVCEPKLIQSSKTPEEIQKDIYEDQARQCKEQLGALGTLVNGKSLLVNLNALATMSGLILGQIPDQRKRKAAHQNFSTMVAETSNSYVRKKAHAEIEDDERRRKQKDDILESL